ncbi:hypothetical protein [Eleftheria terrae]|uniref:hypothetical protein n=1 Tax=Eleftheria terrae TaxID=1597781 RepID=UPI00263A6A60|nr:hypothetical protein [Eleftheria terrae]WKB51732.1 hypothetical protein N7L95_18285 [Eleftheria terrae]
MPTAAARSRARGEAVAQRSAVSAAAHQVWAAVTRSVSRSIAAEADGDDLCITEVEVGGLAAGEDSDVGDCASATDDGAAGSEPPVHPPQRLAPRRPRVPEPAPRAAPAPPPATPRRRRKPRRAPLAGGEDAWLDTVCEPLPPWVLDDARSDDTAVAAVAPVRAPLEVRRTELPADGGVLAVIAWGFAAVVAAVLVAVMLGLARAPADPPREDPQQAEPAPRR